MLFSAVIDDGVLMGACRWLGQSETRDTTDCLTIQEIAWESSFDRFVHYSPCKHVKYLTGMIIEVLCCALGWPNTFGPISGKHSINRKWHVHMIWVNEVANGSPGATAYSFTSRLTGSRWDFNPFSITTCHLSAKTILFWPLLPRTLSVSHEIKCVWIAFNGRIKPTVYFFFLLNLRRPSFWPQFEKKYQISTLSCVQVLCEN